MTDLERRIARPNRTAGTGAVSPRMWQVDGCRRRT